MEMNMMIKIIMGIVILSLFITGCNVEGSSHMVHNKLIYINSHVNQTNTTINGTLTIGNCDLYFNGGDLYIC